MSPLYVIWNNYDENGLCTKYDSGSAVNSNLFTVQNKYVNHSSYLFVQPLNILCLKSITNTWCVLNLHLKALHLVCVSDFKTAYL